MLACIHIQFIAKINISWEWALVSDNTTLSEFRSARSDQLDTNLRTAMARHWQWTVNKQAEFITLLLRRYYGNAFTRSTGETSCFQNYTEKAENVHVKFHVIDWRCYASNTAWCSHWCQGCPPKQNGLHSLYSQWKIKKNSFCIKMQNINCDKCLK